MCYLNNLIDINYIKVNMKKPCEQEEPHAQNEG